MKRVILAAIAATSVLATPAAGAIIITTWTGQVLSGTDDLGFFGEAEADLTGLAFTSTFTFNTALGASFPLPDGGNMLTGGETTMGGSSPGTATITIGGNTLNLGEFGSYVGTFGGYWTTFAAGGATIENFNGATFQARSSPLLPLDMNHATSVSGACDTCDGVLNGPVAPILFAATTLTVDISEDWVNSSVEPGPLGGVPEPTTWALLIGGFGLVGAMLRRRLQVA